MCGICGIATTHGAADVEALRAMSDLLVHRGPDSGGEHVDGAGRARGAAPLDHRPRSAATSRSRTRTGACVVVQNGEIYNYPELRRELERAGHELPHALRHRGARPPVRGARARLRASGCAACSRSRSGTRGAAGSCSRATATGSSRSTTAHVGGELELRLGAARAAARRDRPRRARGVPRLQLDPGAVLDLPRRPQAAGRARARLGGRRRSRSSATRGPGRRPRTSCATGDEAELVEELRARLRDSVRAHLLSRRAGRRAALGRRRLRGARGARGAGDAGAGAHVHDRLRGAELRRARRRAARRRALRDGPPRAPRATRARAAPAGARGGVRRAVRRLVRAADLPRLAARGRAREGRALGRGRRRALRRLLHVRGRSARRPPRAARAASRARSSRRCRRRRARRASTTRRSGSSARRTCRRSSGITAGRRSSPPTRAPS